MKHLWERQEKQQLLLGIDHNTMSQAERESLFNDLLLGLVEEVAELKRCLVKKRHQLAAEPINKFNIVDQGVDVIKYAVSIMIAAGINCDEFTQAFMDKSAIIDSKWKMEMTQLSKSTRVFVTDLDGVVADFFGFMDTFCFSKIGKVFADLEQYEREDMLREFYLAGCFRELPVIQGAPEALSEIKAMGHKLVVVTARPYHKIRRIAADTYHWLERAGIEADLMIWSASKSNAVWEHIHPAKVVAFVEDDAKHALDLAMEGIQVLQLISPVSVGTPDHRLIKQVNNWGDILRWMATSQEGSDNE